MGFKFNVRNCQYAPVTANSDSSYTIGAITPLPNLREIDMSFKTATGELYGDGKLVANDTNITGATLKIGIDKIPQAAHADILGHNVTGNGIEQIKTSDNAKEIAIYAEIPLNNGGYEAFWLTSGKAEPTNITGQQAEGNITYTTDELTINCIARLKDNLVMARADTDNSNFDATAQAAFKLSPDVPVATQQTPANGSETPADGTETPADGNDNTGTGTTGG